MTGGGGSDNHFAPVAAAYAAFRPRYPQALYEWLAGVAPATGRVWDCGCGSGQASLDLARHFLEVDASDASAEQLGEAPADPRVRYRVCPAEDSGYEDGRFDLVTVAQALHWFDCPRFYAEARRVLRPGGVLAAWSYAMCSIPSDAGDALLQDFYHGEVGPYWPAERSHVDEGYARLAFPAPPLAAPPFTMVVQWSLPELLGYIGSWSATARYRAARGHDPVAALGRELSRQWGDPRAPRAVHWPLTVLATVLKPRTPSPR